MKASIRLTVCCYYTCDEGDIDAEKSVLVTVSPDDLSQVGKLAVKLATDQLGALAGFPGTNVRLMTPDEAEVYEANRGISR
jgi:hypothetical protein